MTDHERGWALQDHGDVLYAAIARCDWGAALASMEEQIRLWEGGGPDFARDVITDWDWLHVRIGALREDVRGLPLLEARAQALLERADALHTAFAVSSNRAH